MKILDTILSAGNTGLVNQLAGQFGITATQATLATSSLLPGACRRITAKTRWHRRDRIVGYDHQWKL